MQRVRFFLSAGYNFIFATRRTNIDGEAERKRVAQMRKAYEKLRADKMSNMSTADNWSTAPFHELCSESDESCTQLQEVCLGTGNLFRSEAAQKTFCKVSKNGSREDCEGSVLALVKFDIVILGCVQSIKKALSFSECYIDPETGKFKPDIDFRKKKDMISER